MKTLRQTFLFLIFIAALSLYKDDLIKIYDQSVDYLGGQIYVYQSKGDIDLDLVKNGNDVIDEIAELPKNIETPGALKIVDSLLASNKTELSVKNIINLTNQNRKENGDLSDLIENYKLNFSAEKKLQDMFTKQYFEHVSPEGVGVSDLGDQVSYEYITIGENLALGGFRDDKALVDVWMNSPGHRENILNKNYREIGVAVGKGSYEGKDVWMAVQHFGLPKNTCIAIDGALGGVIKLNKQQIEDLEEELSIRKEMIANRVVYEDLSQKEQIEKYNTQVLFYNKLIIEIKKQIDIYNKQVRDFNACVAKYTTPAH